MDGAALEFGLLPSIHGKLLLILFAFATYTMSSHRYLFGQSVYRTGAREHLSGSVYKISHASTLFFLSTKQFLRSHYQKLGAGIACPPLVLSFSK